MEEIFRNSFQTQAQFSRKTSHYCDYRSLSPESVSDLARHENFIPPNKMDKTFSDNGAEIERTTK